MTSAEKSGPRIAFTPSANITITGYRINGGAILNAAQLESGLSTTLLAAYNATVDVTVVYSVGAVVGGGAETIDFLANSRRTPATTVAARRRQSARVRR